MSIRRKLADLWPDTHTQYTSVYTPLTGDELIPQYEDHWRILLRSVRVLVLRSGSSSGLTGSVCSGHRTRGASRATLTSWQFLPHLGDSSKTSACLPFTLASYDRCFRRIGSRVGSAHLLPCHARRQDPAIPRRKQLAAESVGSFFGCAVS